MLQQFDGNILEPRIPESATNMPNLRVFFAILFFGEIWGIVGMMVDIPTFVTLTRSTKRTLADALKKKRFPIEEGRHGALDYIDTGDGSLHYRRRGKKE